MKQGGSMYLSVFLFVILGYVTTLPLSIAKLLEGLFFFFFFSPSLGRHIGASLPRFLFLSSPLRVPSLRGGLSSAEHGAHETFSPPPLFFFSLIIDDSSFSFFPTAKRWHEKRKPFTFEDKRRLLFFFSPPSFHQERRSEEASPSSFLSTM